MMTTLDGKITSGTGENILDDYFSLYTKIEDKLNAKSWIIGRVTMQAFADNLTIELPKIRSRIDDKDYIVSIPNDYNVFTTDTKGVLRWKDNTIRFSNIKENLNLVVIVTINTPKEYLSYLQDKNVSYIFGGEEDIDFRIVFKKIKSTFGIDRILLEGGGILNGSIMNENLIDQISLLLLPLVVNRTDAPSLFEGDIQKDLIIKKFTLTNIEKLENDVVWLKYLNKLNKI